ncbi:hypothetical protein CHLNCDRAFT_20797 [Chlorella variabilis]|uniref:FAD dependent oxidoreductase domain-containing protein n=1 Tax=Chlorella variabilis TaxID=554065 RepID=E1Z9Z6_CHLVA|nr:hypothetical protein CHLNCDRAFT_20797 [Chlorella variabilis]EFN57606.1 hypothetical protein CHLNCDRAFT_20797 [Chlorella variabilis]|eukprot:XP_005849708.1 hypothetical protein CHLNCDRAFT_20797 [Chlorella variabilis]
MSAARVLDCVVVGAGGAMGSAALFHLAKRGVQVLGLEAQPSAPHSYGSSHGLSRIIRLSYFEHPSYVPLVREAYRLWRGLEQESGERLLTMTGCINTSPPDADCGPGTSCFQGALRSGKSSSKLLPCSQEHGLAHEVLTSSEVEQRFPGYHLPPSFQTMYEPEGGFLVPERCIQAHLHLAQRHGAELLCGAKVLGWQVGAQGLVRVQTTRGEFIARRLVLAAGGWMPQLVPQLRPILTVERQVVGWFQLVPEQRQHFTPQVFPVFLLHDETRYFYGFPADEHGFKVGLYHHLRQVTTADSVDRSVSSADEEALRQCVRRYFPEADGRLTRAAVCTFTNTPDLDFILDRHPLHGQVVLASCCSGHGFKFAPVIGSILADLAMEGATPHDISPHRLSRQRPGQAAVLDAFARGGGDAAARL